MKKTAIYLIMCLLTATSFACSSKDNTENKNSNEISTGKIEVYYFHFTRRCVTCNAVESVTTEALNEYFSEAVENENIVFKSVNLDEDSSKEIAEKLKVSGQTLLFVAGDKQINLTNDGFMYAKNQPDKLKSKVKETIEELLK